MAYAVRAPCARRAVVAVAARPEPRSVVGRLSAPRIVSDHVEELYDYDVLRALKHPTMFNVRVAGPTIVLGSSQPASVLRDNGAGWTVRRRRGGGGAVCIHPDDVWVDWWIPASDERWVFDVHLASAMAGSWWRETLQSLGVDTVMHQGGVVDDPALRVACFTGRGPGELFVDERKVLGVTQWRVREGLFLSTIIHAAPSLPLIDALALVPEGLAEALDHHGARSLGIDPDETVVALRQLSWPADYRQLYLMA